ncbi:hypothetical protein FSARC_5325 [Fusarium sarcochroum]|uniref:Chromo domain-containing protein n=1 Tax=Fusarium sarcochroum TaxID=1208366 RepID=A0A8H4TZR1_9HYPO|nr:hypothetical protein FSARC_5325 [Fusarium sarcochroum]
MPPQPTIEESPDPEDNWRPDDNWRSKAGQSSRSRPSLGRMLPPSRRQSQATGSDAGPSSQARPRSTGTPMNQGPRGHPTPAPKGMSMAARRIPSTSLTPGPDRTRTSAAQGTSDGLFARRGSTKQSSPSRGASDEEVDSTPTPTPEREMSSHDYMRFHIEKEMAALRRQQTRKTTYSEEKFPIERVLHWKIYEEDCIELLVRWGDGAEDTWEPEEIIQEDAESLVYAFWKTQHGRQRSTGLVNYHAFKILEARTTEDPAKPEFLVQWVGYPSSTKFTTWKSYDVVYKNSRPQYIEFAYGEKLW